MSTDKMLQYTIYKMNAMQNRMFCCSLDIFENKDVRQVATSTWRQM